MSIYTQQANEQTTARARLMSVYIHVRGFARRLTECQPNYILQKAMQENYYVFDVALHSCCGNAIHRIMVLYYFTHFMAIMSNYIWILMFQIFQRYPINIVWNIAKYELYSFHKSTISFAEYTCGFFLHVVVEKPNTHTNGCWFFFIPLRPSQQINTLLAVTHESNYHFQCIIQHCFVFC